MKTFPGSEMETGRVGRRSIRLASSFLLATGFGVLCLQPLTHAPAADAAGGRAFYETEFSSDEKVAQACRENLKRISEALRYYQRANQGRLPPRLSRLYPAYLNDQGILRCPFVKESKQWDEWRRTLRNEVFRDPGDVTYAYEMITEPLDALTGTGVTNATVREFKFRQASMLATRGGDTNSVPVVRCLCHRPVLNLTPSGEIYSSDITWEDQQSRFADHDELKPTALFAKELALVRTSARVRRPANPIPARPADLSPQLLDLTEHYNAALDETWHPGHDHNDLSRLLTAPRPFSGVEFDLRGLIQLRSRDELAAFPAVIEGIPVGRKARSLVFLHATAFQAVYGTQVATYVVHFGDGSTNGIPVRYGQELSDWWQDPGSNAPEHCDIAWKGSNGATRSQKKEILLFRTRWKNPRPEVPLHHLDFVSTQSGSAPFLVAVTAED